LNAIILLKSKPVPFTGNGALQSAIVFFLNDKGYIEINPGAEKQDTESFVRLSPAGERVYQKLLALVATEVGVHTKAD
jgi:hypothetical protein